MLNKKRRTVSDDPFVRRHRTFFVGLFLLIPLIVIPAVVGYTFFKSQFLGRDVTLYAVYDNSYGLSRGNRVTISGTTIGHVQDIQLLRERFVVVMLRVKPQYQHLIRKDTKALLKQMNFVVGDWEIELTGGSSGVEVVKDSDTLQSEYPLRIDRTIEQITEMVSVAGQILHLVLSGEGMVGRLLTEETLYHEFQQLVRGYTGLSDEAKRSLEGVDTLLQTLDLAARGGLELIDSIPEVIGLVKQTLEETRELVGNVAELSQTAPDIAKRLEDNLEEAELIMQGLQRNWLLRRIIGEQPDPLLIDYP
ncbi:ABC transporter, permease component [Chitinispirillum alkaliphilum]|nr:ABC transporter, permease component [Chitinispirillum alkaliphilum]